VIDLGPRVDLFRCRRPSVDNGFRAMILGDYGFFKVEFIACKQKQFQWNKRPV
jgi:hypothetical protein